MPALTMVLSALALVLLIAILFAGVAAFVASERLLRVTQEWYETKMHVLAVTADSITLPRRAETTREGIYTITWTGNSATLGEIIAQDEQTVTRRLLSATQSPTAGSPVSWSIFVYHGDPLQALGLPYEEARIPSQVGPLPAWYLPGPRRTWVVLFHGFHASPEEGLRIVPALQALGFPILDMCYRNDRGAPRSPDGFYHLGDTEWQDVESGVRYALAHGADAVVLYGWSMGGCLIETFLRRSPLASCVRAAVLDAPALNWHAVLDTQMHKLHFPHWLTYVVEWFAWWRAGITFSALNYVHAEQPMAIPTLIFHGTADSMVPIAGSDTFARRNASCVTYVRVADADHTQSWNANSKAYEDAVAAFLGPLP